MPEIKSIPALAVCLSGLMLAIRPEPTLAVAFIGAAILFGFEMWLMNHDDKRIAEIELQMRVLKEKTETIALKQGLGR